MHFQTIYRLEIDRDFIQFNHNNFSTYIFSTFINVDLSRRLHEDLRTALRIITVTYYRFVYKSVYFSFQYNTAWHRHRVHKCRWQKVFEDVRMPLIDEHFFFSGILQDTVIIVIFISECSSHITKHEVFVLRMSYIKHS